MREIKFRFWTGSVMRNDVDGWAEEVGINNMFKYLSEGNDYVIMQFTGLKDSKGTDIYEGDIVHMIYDDGRDLMGVDADYVDYVYFDSDCAGFMIHREQGADTLEYDLGKSIEVVGNIYQNPTPHS